MGFGVIGMRSAWGVVLLRVGGRVGGNITPQGGGRAVPCSTGYGNGVMVAIVVARRGLNVIWVGGRIGGSNISQGGDRAVPVSTGHGNGVVVAFVAVAA